MLPNSKSLNPITGELEYIGGNDVVKESGYGINGLEDQDRALKLRKTGMGYGQIARAMGLHSAQAARGMVLQGIKRIEHDLKETAAEVRELEAARLDEMLMAIWPKCLAGDNVSIRTALQISERRSKLFGADAPLPLQRSLSMHISLDKTRDVFSNPINVDLAERLLASFEGASGGTGASGESRQVPTETAHIIDVTPSNRSGGGDGSA